MYKSLLSSEELNALLSAEQVSELTAVDHQSGEPHSHSSEAYLQRIQQLEHDISQLVRRVELLESQLQSSWVDMQPITSRSEVAAAAVRAGEGQVRPEQDSEAVIYTHSTPDSQATAMTAVTAVTPEAAPILLSRVETYRQKPKRSLFR